MSPELRAELEGLAMQLDAEICLCTTREHHIRASANANALRHLISRLDRQATVTAA